MLYRVPVLFVLALAVTFLAGSFGRTQDKDKTHEGVVVKAGDCKLVMTAKDDTKEHSHEVAKDAKITCDGKDCKLEDLKKGFTVKVTTDKKATTTGDKEMAVKIEAGLALRVPASPLHSRGL